MAVEARHLNVFPSHLLLPNRRFMSTMNEGAIAAAAAEMYPAPAHNVPMPETAGAGAAEGLFLPYASEAKADSDLTLCYLSAAASKKRPRDDSIHPLASPFTPRVANQDGGDVSTVPSYLGEAVSAQIVHQHSEIGRFIAQHMEKVRVELEERRWRNVERMLAAVGEGAVRRLRAKEEEIGWMGKLNLALAERVRSLSVENQIWKDMAHANEAEADALRANLHQALISTRRRGDPDAAAESYCGGSCADRDGGKRTFATEAQVNGSPDDGGRAVSSGGARRWRWCRKCGEEESCVLLLPCRHLCLCTVCGSSLYSCPVCHAYMDASVHVNMS